MGDEKARRFFSFLDRKIKCEFCIFYDCYRVIRRQIGTNGNFPRNCSLFLRIALVDANWQLPITRAEKCISINYFVRFVCKKNAFTEAFCV